MTPFLYFSALLMEALLSAVTGLPTLFFARLKIRGLENLSDLPDGPLIIMSNHTSQLDPGLINLALPWNRRFRPIFGVALSKKEYLHLPLGRWLYGGRLFWLGGAYPAYLKQPTLEESLPHHLKVLDQNRTVVIFPEGKISLDGNFSYARPGVALMAHKSGGLVLPVYIYGSYFLNAREFFTRRRKIGIIFGRPVRFSDYADPKREYTRLEYRAIAEQMFNEVKKLA